MKGQFQNNINDCKRVTLVITKVMIHYSKSGLFATFPLVCIIALGLFISGCAVGPSYSNYEWRKAGGKIEERDRLLAEAKVHAIQAYPDPISRDQITAEPINASAIRTEKRNEVIINFMASKGWHLVEKKKN